MKSLNELTVISSQMVKKEICFHQYRSDISTERNKPAHSEQWLVIYHAEELAAALNGFEYNIHINMHCSLRTAQQHRNKEHLSLKYHITSLNMTLDFQSVKPKD